MSKKTTVTLPGQLPFLGCHAAAANGLCFSALTAAPMPAGIRDKDVLTQFDAGMAWEASRRILADTEACQTQLGGSIAKGVKIDQYITSPVVGAPYLSSRAEWTETETRPASSTMMVKGLCHADAQVSMHLTSTTGSVAKEPVVIPDLPASPGKPFAPAPHVMLHGDLMYVTGQISYDFHEGYPAAAEVNDPTTWYESVATAQTRYVMRKYEKILKYLGGSFADCLRLEIYLTDLTQVVEVELVLRAAFGDVMPARAYMPVVKLGAGRCVIEVTSIFRRPGCKAPITRFASAGDGATWLSPAAVEFGGFVFTSTLAGNPPGHLDQSQGVPAQVDSLFDRLGKLPPLKGALDGILFTGLQVASGADLGEVRWALQQAKALDDAAVTVVRGAPLLWTRGALQADFVCAL